MGVEPKGFEDFRKHLGNLSAKVESAADRGVGRSANILRTNVIKEINSQPGSWPALNEKYSGWKAAHGGSNLMLVSGIRKPGSNTPSTNYRNSFAITRIASAKYEIGSNHPQANVLEYGFEIKKIKARPHFAPAFEKSTPLILEEYKGVVKEIFKR